MTDRKTLDKARAWAKHAKTLDKNSVSHTALSAAEVIQSLSDEWVDAAKVRKYIADWREGLAAAPRSHYEEEMLDDLEALLLPPAPRTLADMTPEEREACQWRQVEAAGADTELGVIALVTRHHANVIWSDGIIVRLDHQDLTPRLDLPKLKWPGSEEEGATETELDPAYLYRDFIGGVWEHIDGKWVCGTKTQRREWRANGHGLDALSPNYGPYTRIDPRIDKKGASHE